MESTKEVKVLNQTANNISASVQDPQERNRLWWEKLPMTYEDWENEKREPESLEDFLKVEKKFLEGNPWLKTDFSFDKFAQKEVLEIGCGSGVASCLFAKNGATIVAVDITQNAVKITKRNAELQGVNVKVFQQDAEKLSFNADTYDYVFSWGVLHHSRDTIQAFREVHRVLKVGGEGLIMVYNKNSLRYYLKGLFWLIAKGKIFQGYNLKSVQDLYCDGFYHRHFTPDELRLELEKIGLSVSKISITHMGSRMLPFVPRGFEEWLKREYGWLLIAEFKK